jgi:hypothetical protein
VVLITNLRFDMSPQIDQLPGELLHVIFSHLDPSTLGVCRLVKRQWKQIGNEYILPATLTKTTAQLSELIKSFTDNDIIAGHVRSITFAKKLSEDWPDQSNVSEGQCSKTFLLPFKRLERLAVLDGRPFPTMTWPRETPLHSDGTTKQLENLLPALSNPSVHLSELCVEWVDTRIFLYKADELGRTWRSLTVLRLGLTRNKDLNGVRDLLSILRGLSNLRQLHLSTLEDHYLPVDYLIDEREIAWPRLTCLTLQGFIAREPTLQRLFSLPRLRSIAIARMGLEDNGCWIRIMKELQMRKCAEVHLSGWLVDCTTGSSWFGDSNEDGSLFREVVEWLKRDDSNVGSCPLNISNMN